MLHYSVREQLIDEVAKRMNPEKYTWSPIHREEVLESARNLLEFITGFCQGAVLAQEVTKKAASFERQVGIADTVLSGSNQGLEKPIPVPVAPVNRTATGSVDLQMSTNGRTTFNRPVFVGTTCVGMQRGLSVDPNADR